MKKFLLCLLTAVTLAGGMVKAEETTELFKVVPRNAAGLVYINVEKILKSQAVQGIRKESIEIDDSVLKLEEKLKPYGVTLDSFCQKMLIGFGLDGKFAILAKTAIREKDMPAILNALEDPASGLQIAQRIVDGKTVYLPMQKDAPEGETPDTMGVSYVKEDVVVMAPFANFSQVLSGIGKIRPRDREVVAVAEEMPLDSDFFLVFKSPTGAARKEFPQFDQFANIVNLLYINGKLTGENGKDISIRSKIYCLDTKASTSCFNMIQGFLLMATGSAFSSEPELGQRLMECINITREREDITIQIDIPEELLVELSDYSAYHAAKMEANGQTFQVDGLLPQAPQPALPAGTEETAPATEETEVTVEEAVELQ